MKYYELSVYASDSSNTFNIDSVYQAENKLIVLANLKNKPGISLCQTAWFSVGVKIDAPENVPVECYLIGGLTSEKRNKAYTPITEEAAKELIHGLNPVSFTQTKLNPNNVEFVKKYREEENRIRNTFDIIMLLIAERAEQRKAEFKAQGISLEPIDSWKLQFGHSPKVMHRVEELATQNQLGNKEELKKLMDECTLETNKLIQPKVSFCEKIGKFTGVSRHGLYAATATVVTATAVALTLMNKSQP